jgi:hypothetical protein
MLAKHLSLGLAILAVVIVGIAPATADWDPADGHKMHYPQLPNPNGWDVNVTGDTMYDDWECSGTGPVSDVHFWVSWKGETPSTILFIDLKIWTDTPAEGQNPSHPNAEVWSTRLSPGDWTVRAPDTGDQGWIDFEEPGYIEHDHQLYYQINVDPILNPFEQTEGEIYWLGIHIGVENTQTQIGWKTTLENWNDDGAYYYAGEWHEMIDPLTGQSMDMAFVITPEPATMSLLALGGLAILRKRRAL